MINFDSYVFHKKYGVGKVKHIDNNSLIVHFVIGLKKFKYPKALNKVIFEVFDSAFVIADNKLIRYIGEDIFVHIPAFITVIGDGAFQDSDVQIVSLGNHVTSIEDKAFMNCKKLINVLDTSNLRSIGSNAFSNCILMLAISLPKETKKISKDSFDKTVQLRGPRGSYTQKFAKKNNYSFLNDEMLRKYSNYHSSNYTDYSRNINDKNIRNESSNPSPLLNFQSFKDKLSDMNYFEKVVYGVLIIIALFYPRENIGNMFEQLIYGHVVTSQGTYNGDTSLGSINGEGTMEFNDGKSYSGEWSNGLPNGAGELVLQDGSTFEGEFKQGKFNDGEYITKDNQNVVRYNIVDSELESYRYSYDDGSYVERSFLADTPDYLVSYIGGDSYSGSLSNGTRSGIGEYTWADGTVYSGSWKNDAMNGSGQLFYPSGTVLDGEFADNSFINGRIIESQNGYYYLTGVSEGTRNGTFGIINHYEESYIGTNYNESIAGTGVIDYKNDDKYEGSIVSGRKEGYGEYTWADGEKYIGYWANDTMNGQGTYYYTNTQRIEGYFLNGKPNGTCIYYDKNGVSYNAYWENGEQISIYQR